MDWRLRGRPSPVVPARPAASDHPRLAGGSGGRIRGAQRRRAARRCCRWESKNGDYVNEG